MKTLTINDSRINRNNTMGGYQDLSSEIVKSATGFDKKFEGGQMSWNEYKGTAYKQNSNDVQVDIVLDFNTGTAIISYDEPKKSALDLEMEMWEARANDEFGTTLKEIEKASMKYFGCDEDEYGIASTPISYPITAYALDGNRKHTAKVIIATLDEWDVLEDEEIKALTDKLNKLAA